jgi:hypothetical protein
MKYRLGKYAFAADDTNHVVYWGNDDFWIDWPKMREAGYLEVSDWGTPGDYGHITITVPAQTRGLAKRIS